VRTPGRARGYHPLLAARADTSEVRHVRLRKGQANNRAGPIHWGLTPRQTQLDVR